MEIMGAIDRLRDRRRGTAQLEKLTVETRIALLSKKMESEAWEISSKENLHTRYAPGMMQEIDSEFSRLAMRSAEMVAFKLRKFLAERGVSAEIAVGGSAKGIVHVSCQA